MSRPRRIYGTMSASMSAKLISLTKSRSIEWVKLESLEEYFDDDGMSINDHPVFSTYLLYLSRLGYRPVPSQTYITHNASDIFVLSRHASSFDVRLDKASMSRRQRVWSVIHADQVTLLRLFNIIRIVDSEDTKQSIENMLYAINDIRV